MISNLLWVLSGYFYDDDSELLTTDFNCDTSSNTNSTTQYQLQY